MYFLVCADGWKRLTITVLLMGAILSRPSLRGSLAMSGDICMVTTGVAPGIQWVKARAAAKHPTVHRAAGTSKNYLALRVNPARGEKPLPHPCFQNDLTEEPHSEENTLFCVRDMSGTPSVQA